MLEALVLAKTATADTPETLDKALSEIAPDAEHWPDQADGHSPYDLDVLWLADARGIALSVMSRR